LTEFFASFAALREIPSRKRPGFWNIKRNLPADAGSSDRKAQRTQSKTDTIQKLNSVVKKFSSTSRWFRAALTAILLAAVWVFGAWGLAERLIVEKPLERADVIVVLGGSATYIERTQKAARLFRENVSERIVLTDDGQQGGWSRAEKRNPYFVELARNALIAQDVPAENIEILSPPVDGTKDEALLVGREIEKRGWQRVLIVTSAYHSRRALWLFGLYAAPGKAEIGIVSPAPGDQTPVPFSWWLSKKGWPMVAGEYLKSAYYTLFAW
jgi:uncharacterized SAM-binding protein YcdF (DUF218 family)